MCSTEKATLSKTRREAFNQKETTPVFKRHVIKTKMDFFKSCDKTTLKAVRRIIAVAEDWYGKEWANELEDLLLHQIDLDITRYQFDPEVAGFRDGIACRPICNLLCITVTQDMTKNWDKKVWVLGEKSSQKQIVCSIEHWREFIRKKLQDTKENSKLHSEVAKKRVTDVLSALENL